MTASGWRIVKRRHSATAFDGEGARLHGGRWNLIGTPVVYVAGTRALAALELLVHLKASDLADVYALLEVAIPSALIERIPQAGLPDSWSADPIAHTVQVFGSDWVASRRSCVLQVPSAVIPAEHNFLLNPLHPKFGELVIGEPEPFTFDPRLLKS